MELTMTPMGVPDEVLLNAQLIQAQLLVCTHAPEITCLTRDIYDVNLEIHSMNSGNGTLLIQIDLGDLYTEYTVTMLGCLKLIPSVLVHLNQRIEDNVNLLYETVSQYKCKHTMCLTNLELWDNYANYPVPQ